MAYFVINGVNFPVLSEKGNEQEPFRAAGKHVRAIDLTPHVTLAGTKRRFTPESRKLTKAERNAILAAFTQGLSTPCTGEMVDGAMNCIIWVTGVTHHHKDALEVLYVIKLEVEEA